MTTNNKLDKMFGPAGTSAGIFLIVTGLIVSWFSLPGLILVVIGAFIGFTATSTLIDFDRKRVRFSNNLFGIIRTGPWISVDPDMKIGIKRSNRSWRTYSRSNRTLDIQNNDFRLILHDSGGKEIMPLKKARDPDSAKAERDKICSQLGLSII